MMRFVTLLVFFQLFLLPLHSVAQDQPVSLSQSTVSTDESILNPKTKAFLVVSGYGLVGGALLGFASMAFGESARAIAQGASLGLYAGIIFGAYVLYTFDDAYQEYDPYPDDYDNPYRDYNTFSRYQIQDDFKSDLVAEKNSAEKFYIPITNISF
ncbi:MAG: hypothetical protein H6621_01630 [Halobacteriovoraceae bacterium]|nr:hypothetical protein [Halobacteriovoraceae bacterium]